MAKLPARHVLYQHFVVSMDELPATIQRSFCGPVRSDWGSPRIIPAGPPFAMYNTDTSPWDVNICAPIATPISPSADFQYMGLPATRIVSLVHIGPYEGLGRAYEEMQSYSTITGSASLERRVSST